MKSTSLFPITDEDEKEGHVLTVACISAKDPSTVTSSCTEYQPNRLCPLSSHLAWVASRLPRATNSMERKHANNLSRFISAGLTLTTRRAWHNNNNTPMLAHFRPCPQNSWVCYTAEATLPVSGVQQRWTRESAHEFVQVRGRTFPGCRLICWVYSTMTPRLAARWTILRTSIHIRGKPNSSACKQTTFAPFCERSKMRLPPAGVFSFPISAPRFFPGTNGFSIVCVYDLSSFNK